MPKTLEQTMKGDFSKNADVPDIKSDELDELVDIAEAGGKYFLRNNAKSSVITIKNQRLTKFFGKAENGVFERKAIIIGMHRESGVDKEVADFNLGKKQKVVILYVNGKLRGTKVVPIEHSFVITHYPHLVGYSIGTNEYDKREYNCCVGQMMMVESKADYEKIFNDVGFMEKVNEKGNPLKSKLGWANVHNKSRKEAKQVAKKNMTELVKKMPKEFETVDMPVKTEKVTVSDPESCLNGMEVEAGITGEGLIDNRSENLGHEDGDARI